MSESKKMAIANFNITFGPNDEPMLSHFDDILYPAFLNDWKVRSSRSVSYFSGVELKEINSEYVLTGNLIRETQYRVRTVVVGDKLISSPSRVPTAPYSRFIIYLKSHRMILVKNEGRSPNLKGFQSVLTKVVTRYVREVNHEKKKLGLAPLPNPIINIVNMPLPGSVDEAIEEFEKIQSVRLRFFPLNNDIDPSSLLSTIRLTMESVDSKTGNLVLNSPKSPTGTSNLLKKSLCNGTASVTIKGINKDGMQLTIADEQLGSELQIPIDGNVNSSDDIRIGDYCINNNYLPEASRENKAMYEKCLDVLAAIVAKV